MLAAIGEDVQRHSAEARAGIERDFAGRITAARRLPRHQRVAAVAALKQERKAALAAAKRKAADELASRRRAAIDARGKQRRRPPSSKHRSEPN